MKGVKRLLPISLLSIWLLTLAGCSSTSDSAAEPSNKDAKAAPPDASFAATTTSRHPFAKHIELAGFRLRETSAGKLEVKFAAINHSLADLGDVTLKVNLHAAEAAATDPPVAAFESKIDKWGPAEVKDVTASASSKLRVYELPDWQFLRASFDILAPAP